MDNILRPLRPVEGTGAAQLHHHHRHNLDSATGATAPPPPVHSLSDATKKQTCLQCRVRKVKCDGRQTVCGNCERLEFECSFQQSPGGSGGGGGGGSSSYATKLPERRRRMQACLGCRSKKIRCLGELPECSNCAKKGLACAYPEPRKRPAGGSNHGGDALSATDSERPPDELEVSSSAGGSSLSNDTLMALVEDYFRHLYPLPSYAFLHKATVVQRCQDRTIYTPLKLAICAITALLLRRTELCHDIWAQRAEQLIMQQLGQPSIFRLQALLLIVRYRIESGDFPMAFMLAALAARAAFGMRLNFERSELPPLAQEARRRLFWSLFLLDDYFCVGLREFELCPQETINLQLPCDEELFQAGQHCRTGILQLDPSGIPDIIGLRGVFLRLVSIRREGMRFIRRVGLGEVQPDSIKGSIQLFEDQLNSLQRGLRQSEQYSVGNLVSTKLQIQFIMLHLSWNQCFCDIYRQFIPGYTEAAPKTVQDAIHPKHREAMKQKCMEHAENIIRIVSDYWNNGDRHSILERDTAVCAFEAARIVLFGASISANGFSMDVAIKKAQLCLNIIIHFFAHSAATRTMRNKLERIIGGYSARLALQHKEAAREPEAPDIRPSARVSQYATSRQRLSVQSLLLQSDFVDDSDQLAVPAYPTLRTPLLPPIEVHGLDDRMSLDGVPEESTTPLIGDVNDDVGFDLNPWMGFPGKDDIYGIPGLGGDLDQEY
ncbi:fungal-specific transcription factor domain-containing protein [Xylariales sp. PMI_506]|nr:fungal-specific transcription factor domain-containing protein [Xylariales sp. PMI_506]